MEAVGFRLKGKCKRNESLRVNGGRPVARTPVGDKPRRIPRSQQCANRHHATRLLRRRDLPFRVYYPQFFQISIYIYIHVFLTPLYLHCIYFRALHPDSLLDTFREAFANERTRRSNLPFLPSFLYSAEQ